MRTRSTTPLLDPQLTDWLRDRASAVWRYRTRGAWFFVVTMLLVTVGLFVCPRAYMSQAKVFVRLGRESVALDPTATTGATVSLTDTRELEINSVLEMIRNRALLQDVVDVVGARTVLGEAPLADPAEIQERLKGGWISRRDTPLAARPDLPTEKAIKRLEKIVTSELGKKSSTINLACKADSPELAQTILAVVLEALQSHHVRANSVDRSWDFFSRQSALVEHELQRTTADLVAAKNDLGVASVDDRRRTLEDDIVQVRRDLQHAWTAQAASDATLRELRQKRLDLPQWQVAEEVQGRPEDAVGATRRALNDLQIREQDLLTRYTVHHPLVVATRQQIEAAKRLLTGQAAGTLAEVHRTPDPGAQQVRLRLLDQETEAEALTGRVAEMTGQLEQLQRELQRLNSEEGRIRQLQQQVDVLQASYGEYLSKREQARVGQAIGDEGISNITVIQPPSYVSEHTSPKRTLIFVLALFVAAAGAVAVALASEVVAQSPAAAPSSVPVSNGGDVSAGDPDPLGSNDAIERVSQLVASARD